MDFNLLDTKADSEAGAFLHFRHPQLGHRLYTGAGADEYGRMINEDKPTTKVGAIVRGMESDAVRAVVQRSSSSAVKGIVGEDPFSLAKAMIVTLKGVAKDGREITSAPEDLDWFFSRSENLAVQVIEFGREKSNFFGATLQRSTSKHAN